MALNELFSQPPSARRKRGGATRWRYRTVRRRGPGDDEDPPPLPAVAGIPMRPRFIDVRARQPQAGTATRGWAMSPAERA